MVRQGGPYRLCGHRLTRQVTVAYEAHSTVMAPRCYGLEHPAPGCARVHRGFQFCAACVDPGPGTATGRCALFGGADAVSFRPAPTAHHSVPMARRTPRRGHRRRAHRVAVRAPRRTRDTDLPRSPRPSALAGRSRRQSLPVPGVWGRGNGWSHRHCGPRPAPMTGRACQWPEAHLHRARRAGPDMSRRADSRPPHGALHCAPGGGISPPIRGRC